MVGFQKKSFVCIALTLVHFLPAAWSWQKKRTAQHQVNMALVGAEITVLQVLVLGNTSRLSPELHSAWTHQPAFAWLPWAMTDQVTTSRSISRVCSR